MLPGFAEIGRRFAVAVVYRDVTTTKTRVAWLRGLFQCHVYEYHLRPVLELLGTRSPSSRQQPDKILTIRTSKDTHGLLCLAFRRTDAKLQFRVGA